MIQQTTNPSATKRYKVQSHFKLPSRTEQHHALSCSLENIMERFTQTGEIDPNLIRATHYGEQLTSEQIGEARQAQARVNSLFESLEPGLREKYGSPTGLTLAFGDPQQYASLVTDGLIEAIPHEHVEETLNLPPGALTPSGDTEAQATGSEASSEASKSEAST